MQEGVFQSLTATLAPAPGSQTRTHRDQSVILLLQTADPNLIHQTADPLLNGAEPWILFWKHVANRGSLST